MQRPLPGTAFRHAETYARTRLPVDQAWTLIPDAYTTSEFHALEQQQVFARSWVPVCLGEEVPAPGDFRVVELAGRSIIVTRNAAGQLRAHHNVCRHRGARLCDGVGHTGRFFTCPYHGWAYDLDGACRATPHFGPAEPGLVACDGPAEVFDRNDMGLYPVRIAEWEFLVFLCLDPATPCLEHELGDLPARLSGYRLGEYRMARRVEYGIEANWKLVAENFMEYYHLPLIHPTLLDVSPVEAHYRWQGAGKYVGLCTWPVGANTGDGGWKGLPPVSGIAGEDAEAARFAWLFPTIGINVMANHVFLLLARPTAAGHTAETAYLLTHPESVAASGDPEGDTDELLHFWDTINREDIAVVERVQDGLRNTAYEGGRMCSRFEESCHRFQNMVIDHILGIARVPPGDDPETARRYGPPYLGIHA